MKKKRLDSKRLTIACLFSATLVLLMAGNIPATTAASFTDTESATGNSFQAWSASLWRQTTQAEFEAGVRYQVDTAISPGNVLLALQTTAATIAQDNFESGGWNGGSGWLAAWTYSGDAAVTTAGAPTHGGIYHLRLRTASGTAQRGVNLSGRTNVHLQFWAKANSFEGSEYAVCLVSPNGVTWYELRRWVNNIDDDNIYHYFDFDLSGYTMSATFYVRFEAHMGQTSDQFYVDDIQFAVVAAYYPSGTVASQVLDTGIAGATWDGLFWDETLAANTDITFEVRASNTPFGAGDANPPWNAVGGTSPVVTGLPPGRYIQWRATLTTTNTANTSTLHEVRVYYY